MIPRCWLSKRCHFSQAQCQLESCLLFGADPREHCLRPRCGPGLFPRRCLRSHLSPPTLTTLLALGAGTVPPWLLLLPLLPPWWAGGHPGF